MELVLGPHHSLADLWSPWPAFSERPLGLDSSARSLTPVVPSRNFSTRWHLPSLQPWLKVAAWPHCVWNGAHFYAELSSPIVIIPDQTLLWLLALLSGASFSWTLARLVPGHQILLAKLVGERAAGRQIRHLRLLFNGTRLYPYLAGNQTWLLSKYFSLSPTVLEKAFNRHSDSIG